MQRRAQKRTTQQFQVVYQAVCQSRSHPSADEVYQRARCLLPRISLGTVYHNLQRLADEGRLSVLFFEGRIARYDPTTTAHAHFICRRCERVEDIFLDQRALGIDVTRLQQNGYTIFTSHLLFHGLCPACE